MDEAVDTVLEWIGFADQNARTRVADKAGLINLTSFSTLDHDGVTSLTESLRKRMPANSRVHVSKGKQDMLLNAANWVGDFLRISLEPELPTGPRWW